ncbi:disease resistance-like protein DSC1 isoform X2 [Prosopis cineraria]|uniref:disease resistance-like protein DSC1 isoform X2 n=1 Tax=Prosopis cineraria TaxID=364024 RepID=UPI0024100576|nr:disease resistance-like protein DSC1 isoform X2 [Prosopis cineraria]
MGSSSKFSGMKYDVFISFRGTDTRHGFLSHLRKELRQQQIDAYVDDRRESGDEISPALLSAIEELLISLIIFSKGYASSKWCLEELVQIIECMEKQKQIVIPVFYKIDPSNVRHQKGSYGDDFANHGKYYKEKVPIWISVLNKAANLSGFHSSNYEDEAQLIEEIAKSLSTKLNIMYRSDFTDLVGIDERIAELESLMVEGSEDVRVIGIWGMGGIGKTTIATAIFDRFCFQYEGNCFLANVREETENHGVIYLKNKIFSILLKENDLQIGTPYGIPTYVRRRLLRKRVLVVLDDISDSDQLENIVGALDCFGSGSRIIITTRDRQVLGKRVDKIYEVKPMMFDDAVRLFMLHAFQNNQVDLEWKELSGKVISYAKGIPLALKVLGSFLYGRSKEEWKSQLEKLNKMPHAKIQDVIRLSYDRLDWEEKNIFLYIACFLKGYQSQQIIVLLNACGFSTIIGLKVLQDKALITEAKGACSEKSRIFMHDLIQEMGWEIVRQESIDDPGKRSRLWDVNDIYQVLRYDMGTKATQSITLNTANIEELHLSPQTLSAMHNLKFLNFYKRGFGKGKLHLPCGLEFLSNKLRLLRWDECPLMSLPVTFSAENLVTLKMNSSILRKLWDGVQNLVNLREILLDESKYLIELPDFSRAMLLKKVNLSHCTSLRSVHPSILSLPNLGQLRLTNCKALTSLTCSTPLKSLTWLSLDGCSRLSEFSVTSEKRLQLFLSNTAINDELCLSSGCLGNIEQLRLDGCQSLINLPYNNAELSDLRSLNISGCNNLASNLHLLLDGFCSVEELLLNDCSNLYELPNNISILSSLQELSLSGSTNLQTVPASIKHLSRLQCLRLDECERLRSLPELPPSVVNLSARNCRSLETLKLTISASVTLEDEVCFHFGNCMKLDQQSVNAIEAKALLEMDKLVSAVEERVTWTMQAQLVYPGSKVPEWFMYRSTQSSIIVDLSSIPQPKDWSFIFCAIVSHSESFLYFETEWYFSDGQQVLDEKMYYFCKHIGTIHSDHVCLWYISELPSQVQRIIEEKGTDNQSSINHQSVEVKFLVKTPSPVPLLGLKGCGLCPTGASGYRSYIQQMELVLQSQHNSVGIGVGCSCDKTNEKEVVPRKSKDFILPAPPTVTWKRKTQGLKDIIFL